MATSGGLHKDTGTMRENHFLAEVDAPTSVSHTTPRSLPQAPYVELRMTITPSSGTGSASASRKINNYELHSHDSFRNCRRRRPATISDGCQASTSSNSLPVAQNDIGIKGGLARYQIQNISAAESNDRQSGSDLYKGIGQQFQRVNILEEDIQQISKSNERSSAVKNPPRSLLPHHAELSLLDMFLPLENQPHDIPYRMSKVINSECIDNLIGRMLKSVGPSLATCLRDYEGEYTEVEFDQDIDFDVQTRVKSSIWQVILPIVSDSLTDQTRKDFFSQLNSSLTSASPGVTGTSNPSSGCQTQDRSEDQKGGGSSRKQKRRDRDADDEASQGSGSGNSRGRPVAMFTVSQNHELACPYHQHKPEKFCRGSQHGLKYQACMGSFRDIAALTQHFRERHYYSDRICDRCLKSFKSKKEVAEHLRGETICNITQFQAIEDEMPLLPTTERRQRLEKLGKKRTSVTPEDHWRRVWDALFPGVACPSPYRRLNSFERVYDRTVETYGPGFVNELMVAYPGFDLVTAESIYRRLTDAFRNELWPFFEADRSRSTQLSSTHIVQSTGSDENLAIASGGLTAASTLPTTLSMENEPCGSTTTYAPYNWEHDSYIPTNSWTQFLVDPLDTSLPRLNFSNSYFDPQVVSSETDGWKWTASAREVVNADDPTTFQPVPAALPSYPQGPEHVQQSYHGPKRRLLSRGK